MLGILENIPTISQLREIEQTIDHHWNAVTAHHPELNRLVDTALNTYDFTECFEGPRINVPTLLHRVKVGLVNAFYSLNGDYVIRELERNPYGTIAAAMMTAVQYQTWSQGDQVDPIEWIACYTASYAYETYFLDTTGQPYDVNDHRAEYEKVLRELDMPEPLREYLNELMETELAIAELEETEVTVH